MLHTSRTFAFGGIVLLAGTLAGCSGNATAPAPRHAVKLQIASLGASPSVGSVAGLQLTTLRLSIGQTSLGSGDQFGCQDCQTEGSESLQSASTPTIVTIPAAGGSVSLSTEQVPAGTYGIAEIDLAPGTGIPGQAANNTIEISGSYQGSAFTIALPVIGTFRQVLSPPVTVSGTPGVPLVATLSLPVASWFTANGASLNPADPRQLAQIETNIRSYFSVPETGGRAE